MITNFLMCSKLKTNIKVLKHGPTKPESGNRKIAKLSYHRLDMVDTDERHIS